MDNLKGNSFAAKKEAEASSSNTPVATNSYNATKQKKEGPRFFSEDAKTVGSHVLGTVLIPSLQKLLSDAVKNAIDWIIYGSKGSKPRTGAGTISYSSFYQSQGYNQQGYSNPMVQRPTNSVYSVDDMYVPTRQEAEAVLARMNEAVIKYGSVSVLTFYNLIGQPGQFTSDKYGWRNVESAYTIQVTGNFPWGTEGWAFRFPPITVLER